MPPEGTHDEDFVRFAESADEEVHWNADRAALNRLADDESIQLENRGVTPQTSVNLHSKPRLPAQTEFWRTQTTHKNTIAAKLREVGMTIEAQKLECCHSRYVVATCGSCGLVRKFPNRCDQLFCPECQPSLSNERKRQVEWWTATLRQPKHVVLTVKNIPHLTPGHVAELRKWFTALRRRRFAKNWTGGFYSLEVTKEDTGWHLHIHALIEAKWIDAPALAITWQNVTNGLGRIVKVRDCRDADYLAEVTKYAVKGSQLAGWKPDDIKTFILAFKNKRTFGVFGSLYGARTEFAEFIATLKAARPKCTCGSCNVRYQDEMQWLTDQMLEPHHYAPRSPPAPTTAEFQGFAVAAWPD